MSEDEKRYQMEEVPNLINICPTNPIQNLNLNDFFKILCVHSNGSLDKTKKIDVGTGAPQRRQEVYWE